MSLTSTLKFIINHPLNKDHKLHAVKRFFNWQVNNKLNPWPVIYPITDRARIIVKKGMTGATGNLYCGLHEYNDMFFLLHFLRKGDLFADIGANVGSYTVLAAGHCGVETISFEPAPSTFNHLLDNIHLNRAETLVNARNMALGSTKGTIPFTTDLDTINHVAKSSDKNTVDVPVDSLDDILNGRCPVLLKIDVEGYETEVLSGAAKTLENPGLKAIIIELNGSGAQYGYDEKLIHDLLLKSGFAPYNYEPKSRKLILLESFGSLNTIYIRDLSFVEQRIKDGEAVHVNGKKI